jgi:hypothetical protein
MSSSSSKGRGASAGSRRPTACSRLPWRPRGPHRGGFPALDGGHVLDLVLVALRKVGRPKRVFVRAGECPRGAAAADRRRGALGPRVRSRPGRAAHLRARSSSPRTAASCTEWTPREGPEAGPDGSRRGTRPEAGAIASASIFPAPGLEHALERRRKSPQARRARRVRERARGQRRRPPGLPADSRGQGATERDRNRARACGRWQRCARSIAACPAGMEPVGCVGSRGAPSPQADAAWPVRAQALPARPDLLRVHRVHRPGRRVLLSGWLRPRRLRTERSAALAVLGMSRRFDRPSRARFTDS